MRSISSVCFLVAIAIHVSSAHAVSIPIANPGFETDILAPGVTSSGAPANWSNGFNIAANGVAYHPTATELPGGAPQGLNVAVVLGLGSTAFNLFQNVGTVSAGTYTLTYDVGDLIGYATGGYQVLLVAKSGSTATTLGTDNNSQSPIAPGQFKPGSLSVTVPAGDPKIGQTLAIRLIALGGSTSSGTYAFFDDLKLQQTPVPEPGTFALLGLGAFLALATRWRRPTR